MFLLLRPKPYNNESFTSYLTRIACENNVSPHDLWRLIAKSNSHYPQSSFSSTLDFYPNNMISMNQLSNILLLDEQDIQTLTFANVLRKFGINEDNLSNSRMLSGLTYQPRIYCPLCLKEKSYYKIIWQVKEINFCNEHKVILYSSCWRCKKEISLLPSNGLGFYCSHCNANLSSAPLKPIKVTPVQKRCVQDWNYLLFNNFKITPLKDLSYEQMLAFKLLYITRSTKNHNYFNIQNIKQIARNTKSNQTYIHLNTILNTIRMSDVSLEDFFNTTPDSSFIDSYIQQDNPLHTKHSCMSPWCSGYNNPGTLNRTTTSSKKKKDGSKHKYYMYCTKCSIEYCIDADTNNLIERGYFIDLGWNKVKYALKSNMSIKEMARIFNTTEDKIKRCIIFLVANGLHDGNNLSLTIPNSHSKDNYSNIELLISQGMPSKKIRKTLDLKYNEFLYYWFYAPLYIKHIKHITPAPYHIKDSKKLIENFTDVINHFIEYDIDITIKNVSDYLNISPETLRYRELLNDLKKAKQIQHSIRTAKKKSFYISKANLYISMSKGRGEVIRSEDIYKYLGVGRTVLVRSHPDVTSYIHNLIKETV